MPECRTLPLSSRGAKLIKLLARAGGSMRIQSIAKAPELSEVTIQRNVRRLSVKALVHKVHGGVLLQDGSTELSFTQRMAENPAPKQRIAAHVAALTGNSAPSTVDLLITDTPRPEDIQNTAQTSGTEIVVAD
ncbi:DNA-binding transcriptional repressor GlpR [Roseovarius litorisediminis]|uniref:DNA-binding transcriptional repressor GlpR n=1 Tax=Roseovarius litorisediminis TaxID=1312363 RepID=A0A1Y5T0P0_9RHOB|nr:DeoR family transcriptional regulator [Roseovarius litorisediminis]SLN49341.1 DNA-binding transcriptional repressor GlpR [Roseovarius litorisediminis]